MELQLQDPNPALGQVGGEKETFRHGEIIFREGEDSDFAYMIESGTVEIFKKMQKGTVLLTTLGPGEIFGEMGLLSQHPRSASAAADGQVMLKKLTRDGIAGSMAGQSAEMVSIMKAMMERLREMNGKISKLIDKQAQFQLASDTPPTIKRVVLSGLSDFLKERMGKGQVITLPFRVGALPDGQEENPMDWNNMLIRGADPAIMSRNHFSIQRGPNGLQVADRGSRTGTVVNDEPIGEPFEKTELDLSPGNNTIIAGDIHSPYRFCVTWETE